MVIKKFVRILNLKNTEGKSNRILDLPDGRKKKIKQSKKTEETEKKQKF